MKLLFSQTHWLPLRKNYINKPQRNGSRSTIGKRKDCLISYVPRKEVLYASSENEDLVFFQDDDATLNGRLALRPKGMTGEGLMYFGKVKCFLTPTNIGTMPLMQIQQNLS